MDTTEAQALATDHDKPTEVYAFSTTWTDDSVRPFAGKIGVRNGDLHPKFSKKLISGQFAIGVHLPAAFALDFREQPIRRFPGAVEGCDADGALILEIDEGGGHFAPVAEFQGTSAEPTAGNEADSIGGAAVNFNVCEQAFSVASMGLGNSEPLETKQGHAHPEYLTGA